MKKLILIFTLLLTFSVSASTGFITDSDVSIYEGRIKNANLIDLKNCIDEAEAS